MIGLNNWEDEGLVLSRNYFSETSIILKVFSRNYGVRKGLVRGGKKTKNSHIFESGNLINLNWRAKNEDALGNFQCELIKTNSALFFNDSLKFSALISSLNLLEFSILENDPEKILYEYTLNLIHRINTSYKWLKYYVLWEIILLEKIGFGLNLKQCVLTNSKSDLKFVSPKSGCAVSSTAGDRWKKKLLPLPQFLIKEEDPSIIDIINGLSLAKNFLEKFSNSIGKKIPFTREHFIDNIHLSHKIKSNEIYK